MAQIMKHVGKYGEKPCVVVYREVPNEPENCLVVETGGLESAQHDDLMDVVQSAEAQEANDVSLVLNRRQFRDGSNMLNGLHFGKKLRKVPVSMVSLTPTPTQSVPLADVNAEIRKLDNTQPLITEVNESSLRNPEPPEVGTAAVDAAQGILLQAQLMQADAEALMKDAEAKLQEAYALDPSLKPKKGPGRPKKTA